jgi:hypothetical protein
MSIRQQERSQVSENRSQNSEKRRPMAALVEASMLLRQLAEPAVPGESMKAAINRAARRAGIPAGLGKRLWYGEARRIDADTMDQIRERAARDEQVLRETLDARRTLAERLAACEAALGLQNSNSNCAVATSTGRPPRVAYRPLAGVVNDA